MANNTDNVFSTLFGAAKDGTSWGIDVAQTFLWVAVAGFLLDWLLPDSLQESATVFANALIITVLVIFGNYVWRRAQADNRRRKANP